MKSALWSSKLFYPKLLFLGPEVVIINFGVSTEVNDSPLVKRKVEIKSVGELEAAGSVVKSEVSVVDRLRRVAFEQGGGATIIAVVNTGLSSRERLGSVDPPSKVGLFTGSEFLRKLGEFNSELGLSGLLQADLGLAIIIEYQDQKYG